MRTRAKFLTSRQALVFKIVHAKLTARTKEGHHATAISVRLRQWLRDRSLARRAPGRPQLAAEMPLWSLRRAAERLAVHSAAHHQRALLALPHPPDREPLGQVREGRCSALAHCTRT